jgi:prepilin-type processing-associated H-X9-DG protein
VLRDAAVSRITENLPGGGELVAAAGEIFDGAVMIAIGGTPLLPFTWRITAAWESRLSADEMMDRLAGRFIPAWNGRLAEALGRLQWTDAAGAGRLSLSGKLPMPLHLTLAMRDGAWFASTSPDDVAAWVKEEYAVTPLSEGATFKRLTAEWSDNPTFLLYLDLRRLLPLLALPMNQALPRSYEALGFDRVENAALLVRGGRASVEPAEPAEPTEPAELAGAPSVAARLAVGFAGPPERLWRVLASPPAATTLARTYPADADFFLHGALSDGAALMDDVNRFLAMIDPEIVEEYREECAEFKREIGFDPHGELLANFAGEWAIGGRLGSGKGGEGNAPEVLFALRLRDVDRFQAYLHALREAFHLETAVTIYRGIPIETAVRSRTRDRFSFAVVEDLLLLALEPQMVADATDALFDRKGLNRVKSFLGVRDSFAPQTSKFAYLDVGEVLEAMGVGERSAAGRPRAASRGGVAGVALTAAEEAVFVDVTVNAEASCLLAEGFVASLREARHQALRMVSMSNLQAFLVGGMSYAAANRRQWPESLQVLIHQNYLPPELASRLYSDPYQPDAAPSPQPYYLYRRPMDPAKIKHPSQEVVMSEPTLHEGGANFGFLDGHVEWVAGPRAEELLRVMREAP